MLGDSDFETPFFSAMWYRTWYECFGTGKELFVVGAWNAHQKLVAIAPLVKTETSVLGIRLREITFMYNSIAPRSSILYRRGAQGSRGVEAIFAELMRRSHEWDCIRLVNVDAALPFITDLNRFVEPRRHKVLIKQGRISPYLKIRGTFEEYFQTQLNAKKRYNIRSRVKKLHNHLDCTVIRYTRVQDMPMALGLSFRVSRASWKGNLGTDMGSTPENQKFYSEITRILAENGQIAIWVASHKGSPIAIHYHLVSDKISYMIITDYDENYESLAPGSFLLYYVIENLFSENYSELDMCGDAFEYKMIWTGTVRKHVNVRIYNRNPLSRLMYYYSAKLLPSYHAIVNRKRL